MLCVAFFCPIFKLCFRVCMTVHFNIALRRDTACQTAFAGRLLLFHINHLRAYDAQPVMFLICRIQ